MVLMLGLALILAFIEDHSDHLLTRGVVRGNVKQVMGGTRLHIAKLVDQELAGCPREEHADDVRIDDIRKGVAPFREPVDVIP